MNRHYHPSSMLATHQSSIPRTLYEYSTGRFSSVQVSGVGCGAVVFVRGQELRLRLFGSEDTEVSVSCTVPGHGSATDSTRK